MLILNLCNLFLIFAILKTDYTCYTFSNTHLSSLAQLRFKINPNGKVQIYKHRKGLYKNSQSHIVRQITKLSLSMYSARIIISINKKMFESFIKQMLKCRASLSFRIIRCSRKPKQNSQEFLEMVKYNFKE